MPDSRQRPYRRAPVRKQIRRDWQRITFLQKKSRKNSRPWCRKPSKVKRIRTSRVHDIPENPWSKKWRPSPAGTGSPRQRLLAQPAIICSAGAREMIPGRRSRRLRVTASCPIRTKKQPAGICTITGSKPIQPAENRPPLPRIR